MLAGDTFAADRRAADFSKKAAASPAEYHPEKVTVKRLQMG
jgi:hypothetical protein